MRIKSQSDILGYDSPYQSSRGPLHEIPSHLPPRRSPRSNPRSSATNAASSWKPTALTNSPRRASPDHFVQDNHSGSSQGILRGLHYQIRHPQGKLVRVIAGEVFDVAVDIRRSSPTCGQWYGVRLSAENKRQLWVPVGFAHGFYVLSDWAEVVYKASDYYAPE